MVNRSDCENCDKLHGRLAAAEARAEDERQAGDVAARARNAEEIAHQKTRARAEGFEADWDGLQKALDRVITHRNQLAEALRDISLQNGRCAVCDQTWPAGMSGTVEEMKHDEGCPLAPASQDSEKSDG